MQFCVLHASLQLSKLSYFAVMIRCLVLILMAILPGTNVPAEDKLSPSDENLQYFERKIRPILAQRC